MKYRIKRELFDKTWQECQEVPEFRDLVEEVPEERWKPKMGETYYFVNDIGEPSESILTRELTCYRTRDEAEAAAERVRKAYKGA